jgi:hypothetical protein
MTNNLILISIPFIAFWFANITGIPQAFKRAFQKEKLRPFDCSKCLSFWMALAYQAYIGFTFESIFIACMSSFFAWVIVAIVDYLEIKVNT